MTYWDPGVNVTASADAMADAARSEGARGRSPSPDDRPAPGSQYVRVTTIGEWRPLVGPSVFAALRAIGAWGAARSAELFLTRRGET